MSVSKKQLREARGTALRRRVWYKALDNVERGIVNLTISIVESVKSPGLRGEIYKILFKLRRALRSAFSTHMEEYGARKLVDIIRVALSFGNEEARNWGTDQFARLLAVNNYNNPAGWKQAQP